MKKLLLVEDEAIIALDQSAMLEKNGYHVVVAHDGERAVDMIREDPGIDLILMDINLGPGMDGPDVAKAILNIRDIPIVFLTSHSSSDMVAKVREITRYGYVIKNSGDFVLLSSIEMAFQLFDAHKKIAESEERFRSYVENASDIIYTLTEEGVFIYVSPNWEKLLGHPASDVENHPFAPFVHPDDVDRCVEYLSEVITTGEAEKSITYRVRHRDGMWRWHSSRGALLNNSGDGSVFVGIARDITDQVNMENQLRRAQKVAHMGSWEFDLNMGIVRASEEARRIYGLGHREWTISEVQEIPLTEYREMLDTRMNDLITGKKNYDVQFKIQRPGDNAILDIHSVAEYDPERNVVTGIIQDITDRKKIEDSLRDSEELYRLLAETDPDFICIHDLSGKIIYMNQVAAEMTGCYLDETTEANIRKIIPDDQLPALTERMQNRVGQFQGVHNYEIEILSGKGERIPVDVKSVAIAKGDVVDSILIVARDISRRKHIEEELERSREEYRVLYDSITDAILVAGTDRNIISYNQAFVDLFGYARGEIVGQRTAFVYADEKQYNEMGKLIRERVQKRGLVYTVEYRKKNGEVFPGETGVFALKDRDGNPVGFIGLIRDVTDRVEADKKIQGLLEEKELLLREVHHRIKNNMTTISSLLALQADTLDDRRAADALRDARGRLQGMLHLYDKLYRSGDYTSINVRQYFKDLFADISLYTARESGLRIVAEVEDISLDSNFMVPLAIIVNELVHNAFKYAYPGRDEGDISVTLKESGPDHIKLIISDDGVGIPAELDIHDPATFGLNLVNILSRQLGGEVTLVRDNGTTFSIIFPR